MVKSNLIKENCREEFIQTNKYTGIEVISEVF